MTIEHVRLTDEGKAEINKAINEAKQMTQGFREIIPNEVAGGVFLIILCQKIIQNSQPPSISSPNPGYERKKIQVKTQALLEKLSRINANHLGALMGQYPEKDSAIYELVGELRILANHLYHNHNDEEKVAKLKQEWKPRLASRFMALTSTAPSAPQAPGE